MNTVQIQEFQPMGIQAHPLNPPHNRSFTE